MTVIICVDDRNGILFNRRRQSRDRVLIDDVVASLEGRRLLITPYSVPLFETCGQPPTVTEDPLAVAEEGDVCFVEGLPLRQALGRIRRLVIYRWNRHYPADRYFDLRPEEDGFRLIERADFAGTSHETITKEIFEAC